MGLFLIDVRFEHGTKEDISRTRQQDSRYAFFPRVPWAFSLVGTDSFFELHCHKRCYFAGMVESNAFFIVRESSIIMNRIAADSGQENTFHVFNLGLMFRAIRRRHFF